MGQYYQPTSLTSNEHLYSHDYGSGLKLMEHSWMSDRFVRAVCSLLSPGHRWYRHHIAWIGDYADKSKLARAYKTSEKIISDTTLFPLDYFIVNHTKKLFIDTRKLEEQEPGWTIHPLPFTHCCGERKRLMKLVGSWCGDEISIETTAPDYKEFTPFFHEGAQE